MFSLGRCKRSAQLCCAALLLCCLLGFPSLTPAAMYDEMSERSYAFYPGGSSEQRARRDLLRHLMESEGFDVYPFEWWHFDYKDWRRYPILNLTFDQLSGAAGRAGTARARQIR